MRRKHVFLTVKLGRGGFFLGGGGVGSEMLIQTQVVVHDAASYKQLPAGRGPFPTRQNKALINDLNARLPVIQNFISRFSVHFLAVSPRIWPQNPHNYRL